MAQCAAMPSEHDTAVMAAYEGLPTVTTQDRTHGAGIPPADLGPELGSVTG